MTDRDYEDDGFDLDDHKDQEDKVKCTSCMDDPRLCRELGVCDDDLGYVDLDDLMI